MMTPPGTSSSSASPSGAPPVVVEARSLAALNSLASNPPQYARNPAHGRQEPLTLYISRVPGTRDVILSTHKPGLENVTEEDVAGSLYYVHLELLGPGPAAHQPRAQPPVSQQAQPSPTSLQPPDHPHPHPNPHLHSQSHPHSQLLKLQPGPLQTIDGNLASATRLSYESTQSTISSRSAPSIKALRRKPVPAPGPSPTTNGSASPLPLPLPSPSPSPSPSSGSSLDPTQLDVHPLLRTLAQENGPTRPPSPPSQSRYKPPPSPASPPRQNGYFPSPSPYETPSPESPRRVFNAYRPVEYAPRSAVAAPAPAPSPTSQRSGIISSGQSLATQRLNAPLPAPPSSQTSVQPSAKKPARVNTITRKPLPFSPDRPLEVRYSSVFAPLDDLELPPPIPPRHPRRRMSDHGSSIEARRPQNRMSMPPPPATLIQNTSAPSTHSPLLRPQPPWDRDNLRPSLDESGQPAERLSTGGSRGLLTPNSIPTTTRSQPPPHVSPSPPSLLPPPAGFWLTLIRREPSTGQQWNVGRITVTLPTDIARLTEIDGGGGDGESTVQLLHIHIDTAGYNKFSNPVSYRQYAGLDPRFGLSTSGSGESYGHPPAHESDRPQPRSRPTGFQCAVSATLGRDWKSNFKGIFRRPHHHHAGGAVPPPPPPPLFTSQHRRMLSSDSAETLSEKAAAAKTKIRGYEFDSPWEGRCEFRVGDGGRLLRCQHHLPPDAPSIPSPTPDHESRSTHEPASELRLHIPRRHHRHSASKSSSDLGVPAGAGAAATVHGHFGRLLRGVSSGGASDEDDEGWGGGDEAGGRKGKDGRRLGFGVVSPFELNLGRERAGGGYRGKRAKMGKLIVYDGGLKMLDLMVAANMGLWWTLWDGGGGHRLDGQPV